jgi:hypothetical protein
LHKFRICPMRATCSVNLILPDLMSLIIFDEGYKVLRSCLPQHPVLKHPPSMWALNSYWNGATTPVCVFGLCRSREGEFGEHCNPERPCDKWSNSCHRRTSVMKASVSHIIELCKFTCTFQIPVANF